MKRTVVLALLLTMCGCVAVTAQSFSLITGREAVTSLDGLWRFHTGDNPAWASPSFDDSHWPLLRSDESWTEQGYPAFNGYAWYRFKVEVPGDGRPVDLLLGYIVDGYEVYADGKMIGSAGSAVATRDPVFASHPSVFRLPASGKGPHSIQIAVRVWTYLPIAFWFGAGSFQDGNEAGDPVPIAHHLQAELTHRALAYVNEYAFGLFEGLIGLAILALFLLRPADKEYLWFSVLLLAGSANAVLHLMMNLGSLPFPLWRVLNLIAVATSAIAALAFFSIVLGARRNFLWRAICIIAAAGPLTAALIYFQWTRVGASFAIAEACTVPAYIWVIAVLLLGVFRKDVSARLLLVPVTLFYGIGCAALTARIAWQLSGSPSDQVSVNPTLFHWPFSIDLGDVINFIFLLALLIFLVRRFSLARKEEERLAGEFEAARTIQSLLIPAAPPNTPGFTVENVYLPAQEVGGDFFQVAPGNDGSLLVVIGDVSGKGLRAAMTVSAIVGALRGCALRAPAEVLAFLNHALRGQVNGFFTCCAALVEADGRLTIANAGHPAPYLNGAELAVSPGLPLGITDGTAYAETSYQLGENDRLTFLSDGVVEARDKTGALFGFARAAALSIRPAETIAETAQRWGQEDDITVLTVARTA